LKGFRLAARSAYRRGAELPRRLTRNERVALAVASASPTHHLVVTTAEHSREELAKAWRRFVRRIERRRGHKPLIYVGSFAKGYGNAGWHLHLLLWDWPHLPTYLGQAREVGLGWVVVRPIKQTPIDALAAARYVLGQQEPVFGSRAHRRHVQRAKFERAFITPQRETLERWKPDLFVALNMAQSESVSDMELLVRLPNFINGTSKGTSRTAR
jgi:hypothetical protein